MRHLRALCAIADTGSLHRAARLLGTSQPALTTQLRRIEHSLGGLLFSRERTGCRPTPSAGPSSAAPGPCSPGWTR